MYGTLIIIYLHFDNLGDEDGKCRDSYSSTMEHMGIPNGRLMEQIMELHEDSDR